MTWDEYYSRFYDWAESTQISRISSISSVGDSSEICEIADALFDEPAATRLIRKMLSLGAKFTLNEIKGLFDLVSKNIYSELLNANKGTYTSDDLDYFYGIVDDETLIEVARKYRVKYVLPSKTASANNDERKPGFFASLLFGLGLADNHQKKHNGRCNGDCANCPPHYGYRYGRWYYGHDHVHGCEFGGNKGSGSED